MRQSSCSVDSAPTSMSVLPALSRKRGRSMVGGSPVLKKHGSTLLSACHQNAVSGVGIIPDAACSDSAAKSVRRGEGALPIRFILNCARDTSSTYTTLTSQDTVQPNLGKCSSPTAHYCRFAQFGRSACARRALRSSPLLAAVGSPWIWNQCAPPNAPHTGPGDMGHIHCAHCCAFARIPGSCPWLTCPC